ncbi:MAG: hypothetical protein QFB86_02065, partial [Patescibacteria group bacterium]|nr:hypothetical protein [Patescibacteria group bacterium]
MEASPHFSAPKPTEPVDSEFARLYEFPTPPPTAEVFHNPVVSQKSQEIVRSKHGITALSLFKMENGRQYEVVQATPKNMRSEIPVVFTTALGTSIHGHNWHTMFHMMDIGYPVVLIGPEGGAMEIPRSPKAAKILVSNLLNISLDEKAANMHNILDETDKNGFYVPGKFAGIGESQGDMTLLHLMKQANSYGRDAIYGDGTAACFPVARKNIHQHLSLLPETIAQASILGKISVHMSLKRAIELPRTINPNPYFWAHAAAAIPTLMSGSAGRAARELEPTTKMNQTFFAGDSWCHVKEWLRIFNKEDFPDVNVDVLPGNHMTIAHQKTLDARDVRMRGLV